jgi:hypothetical protein
MLQLLHNQLYEKYHLDKTDKKMIKAIFKSMKPYEYFEMNRQRLVFDENVFETLLAVMIKSSQFFDYGYSNLQDLELYSKYMLEALYSNNSATFMAIFCPGYTDNGYKNRVGRNNIRKLNQIAELKQMLKEQGVEINVKCAYADVFVENCDSIVNPNWTTELSENGKIFSDYASTMFDKEEVIFLSSLFKEDKYIKGFVESQYLYKNGYEQFRKTNKDFYSGMDWGIDDIEYRNNKLFTIYSILAEYLIDEKNHIYLPTENLYARAKVFSLNGVSSMHLKK